MSGHHWDAYMEAYEATIAQTATRQAPWYVIPADDKKDMRLIVSRLILDRMESMPMAYPKLSATQQAALADARERLENE